MICRPTTIPLLAVVFCLVLAIGPDGASTAAAEGGPAVPTLGGRQVWADHAVTVDGWRLQENVITGHFRLLDGDDRRQAWGRRAECEAALRRLNPTALVPRADRRLVVMVHSLARSKEAFNDLSAALRRRGHDTIAVNYPSTRRGLAAHAAQLNVVMDAFPGRGRVTFITHSLGGPVMIKPSTAKRSRQDAGPASARRITRPPSRGAAAAEALRHARLYHGIAGPSGQALVPQQARAVPLPRVRHCIIAGGNGGDGFNPWLDGDDDGIVRVDEARLPGSDDFVLVGTLHTFLIDHPGSRAAMRRFLAGSRCDGGETGRR